MISEQKDELEKDSSGGVHVHAPVFQICNDSILSVLTLFCKEKILLLTMFALTIII